MNKPMTDFVSVIIPTFNDAQRLKLCLSALIQQTYPIKNYEVIVVDNASTQDIKTSVKLFPQVRLAYEEKVGSYAARNKGITIAKGNILAFTDSDCIPSPDWIEKGIQKLLSTENCGIVAGKINFFFKESGHPNAFELYDSLEFLQQETYVKEQKWGATANLFTFQHVFEDVGLFNADLKSGGDLEWGKRVTNKGFEIVYAADSCIAHPARHSFKEIRKKLIRRIGGMYTLDSFNPKQNLKLTKNLITQLRPPLRSAIRKSYLRKNLKRQQHKLTIFVMIFLLHYIQFFELLRLQIGFEPRRT